jgi:hypothetical protein
MLSFAYIFCGVNVDLLGKVLDERHLSVIRLPQHSVFPYTMSSGLTGESPAPPVNDDVLSKIMERGIRNEVKPLHAWKGL